MTTFSPLTEDLARRALPDPLQFADGTPVATMQMWPRRRAELLEIFRNEVYGRTPIRRPEKQSFSVESVTPGMREGEAIRKQIHITVEGPRGTLTIPLLLFTPTVTSGPVPTFLLLCNRDPHNMDPTRETKSPFWPAEEIIARGYGAAVLATTDIDTDTDDGFQNGVHGIFDGERKPDSWATIAAWAWGASRALDYLETDKDVDARRVAVVGHSRGGKTALWAGAEDERFALVISNDSGCTGAALSRGTAGETVAKINRGFPYWFCDNYKKYGGTENKLPIDQHELLALIAPRPLYVASASADAWADPISEFAACVAASPVYQLLGKQGIECSTMPPPDAPLHSGQIGYHLRTGKHDLTLYDWERFMDFADKRL